MRRPRRLLIAVAMLAGGASVALLSRRHGDEPAPQASADAPKSPKSRAQLPLDLPDEAVQPAHLSGTVEADPESKKTETAAAVDQPSSAPPPEPPPTLGDDHWRPSMRSASYQRETVAPPALQKPPASQNKVPQPKARPKTSFVAHRIVDGDTLSSLALHYLGSSKRFSVIFEANRDRLQSPDLLPIGTELRIPVEEAGE